MSDLTVSISTEPAKVPFETSRQGHLRCIRATGTRPPLVCVLPGSDPHDMGEFLPENLPVYEYYLDEFYLHEATVFPTIEQVAARYIQDLRQVQGDGPYQLCGYSNAGLLAYEMARLLIAHGEDVSLLALVDTWHPRYKQTLSRWESLRHKVIYFQNRIVKYARFVSRGEFGDAIATARYWLTTKSEIIRWRAMRIIFGTLDRPVPRMMRAGRDDIRDTVWAFNPKPYAKRLLFIRTNDRVEKSFSDETAGWRGCVLGGIDVRYIDAEHGKMVLKPYAKSLVAEIVPYLADPRQPRSTSETP